MGGRRGRLISQSDRLLAIKLIDEAVINGARKLEVCKLLGLSLRTYQRWVKPSGSKDRRKGAERTVGNKLSQTEKDNILTMVNLPEYCDMPPSKLVPSLADKGLYLASESTMYRLLKEAKQLVHRSRSNHKRHSKPQTYKADAPNQVWSWDITYLPSVIKV